MSETPFFKTKMGHRFYAHTLAEPVKQLERLNTMLERLPRLREGDNRAGER